MKKVLFTIVYIAAAIAALYVFAPAGDISYTFHFPVSEEQEISISWNLYGRPASYQPNYTTVTEKYFSIEYFPFIGDEAETMFYIGNRSYEFYYEGNDFINNKSWHMFIVESWFGIDTVGIDFEMVYP